MVVIAHVSVKVVGRPEWPGAAESLVDLRACVRLPALNDRAQFVYANWADNSVNVIRHNAPRVQMVTLASECLNRLGHNSGILRGAKQSLSATKVKRSIDSFSRGVFAQEAKGLSDVVRQAVR
jgi:hypothetical protein